MVQKQIFNHHLEVFVERCSAKTFLTRMANETDIMGEIVFLTSEVYSYITGSTIEIDGEYTGK